MNEYMPFGWKFDEEEEKEQENQRREWIGLHDTHDIYQSMAVDEFNTDHA